MKSSAALALLACPRARLAGRARPAPSTAAAADGAGPGCRHPIAAGPARWPVRAHLAPSARRSLRAREGDRRGPRDGDAPRLRRLHDAARSTRRRPRGVRRGDRRDRAHREADDDLGSRERGLARQRGCRQGGRRRRAARRSTSSARPCTRARSATACFDITFETLHGLWKFDQDLDPHPPTPADVTRARSSTSATST